MGSAHTSKANFDLEEINEKLRKEAIKTLEPYGQRLVSDLAEMTDGERAKWLFWNMHENFEGIRKLEPTLAGQVLSTQLTVCDGQSVWTENSCLEKRLELSCKWQMQLTQSTYQNEEVYSIGEGWVDLYVGRAPPSHPVLQENQKGYLHADSSLYPNQMFLYGWITEEVWQEVRQQLYAPHPTCQTDVLLQDNFLFPVRSGLDFVTGPAGSIGLTNIEFRVFSHPTDRRMIRRSDSRQRS